MIVNPSPFVVEYVEKSRNNVCYAVADQTMAELYSKQYNASAFVSISMLSDFPRAEVMIILANQAEENSLHTMIGSINVVEPKKVYSIMQTRLIDNKNSIFWELISDREYSIHDVITVPNVISKSIPKKKSFISLTKGHDSDTVIIQQTEYHEKTKNLTIASEKLVIKYDELLRYNTINTLIKEKISEEPIKGQGNSYSSAEVYAFSREILISYSIYADEKGLYGKAYYAATKNTQFPELRGKSLTSRMEKGLRGNSETVIINNLEKIPYAVSRVIIDDITKCYFNDRKSVTLKTLWFCLRDKLKRNKSYDDQVMINVFSRHSSLSDLYMNIATGDTILKAISELYGIGEEVQALYVIREINLIVNEAIKQGLLFENRIMPLLPAAQHRASKRQAEVRQALTKRCFEDEEEQRIVEFILPLCQKHSLYLAVIIRLLTGISNKEVCALLWKDFIYNINTEVSELRITKAVDNKGKVISHAIEDNWEKFRVLPISHALKQIIEGRKTFLLDNGIDEKFLEECPIIMARENYNGLLKGIRIDYCKPAVVAKKCREAISKAKIEPHLIILPENGTETEMDINTYNGDIFRTNFKDKVTNKAGFGLDEIHYYLGLKKPDTFSQHYCDYTNEYVQLLMTTKLDRWTNNYLPDRTGEYSTYDNENENENVNEVFKGIDDGVPCAELDIHCHELCDCVEATIMIETEHGFKIIVASPILR